MLYSAAAPAVLTVQRDTTARIIESKDYIVPGDLVELK
jgi:hypothetical protein